MTEDNRSGLHHMRSLLWANTQSRSEEYFSLYSKSKGYVLKGAVVMQEVSPALIEYTVECDEDWMTRTVDVTQETEGKTNRLQLMVDSKQNWLCNKSALSFAAGLWGIDFAFSPATNTLHIRRLNLRVGEKKTVNAVWVLPEGLKLERISQSYSRRDDKHYDYEHPSSNFQAVLEVDDFGLIVRYGDLWKRL